MISMRNHLAWSMGRPQKNVNDGCSSEDSDDDTADARIKADDRGLAGDFRMVPEY